MVGGFEVASIDNAGGFNLLIFSLDTQLLNPMAQGAGLEPEDIGGSVRAFDAAGLLGCEPRVGDADRLEVEQAALVDQVAAEGAHDGRDLHAIDEALEGRAALRRRVERPEQHVTQLRVLLEGLGLGDLCLDDLIE